MGTVPISSIAAKEMRVASSKALRSEREVRAHAVVTWDTYLPK